MANIAELLDKLKDARQTVELVDACCMRVCSNSAHFGCPYGDDGVGDCAERLQEAYEDTVENLLQLAEALLSGAAEDQGLVNTPRPAWIPVTERLPERWIDAETKELVNYLIFSPDFGVDVGSYHAGAKRWFCVCLPANVTHWMPLPEAPEVE